MTRRGLLALFPAMSCVGGIKTEDPGVVITDWRPGCVTYQSDKEAWVINGVCIACGECEVGSRNPNLVWTGKLVGTPGACLDRTFGKRRDVPVRPEISEHPHCTLSGRYIR